MVFSSALIIIMSIGCRVLFFILVLIVLIPFTTLFVSINLCNYFLYVDTLSGDLVDKIRDVNADEKISSCKNDFTCISRYTPR